MLYVATASVSDAFPLAAVPSRALCIALPYSYASSGSLSNGAINGLSCWPAAFNLCVILITGLDLLRIGIVWNSAGALCAIRYSRCVDAHRHPIRALDFHLPWLTVIGALLPCSPYLARIWS